MMNNCENNNITVVTGGGGGGGTKAGSSSSSSSNQHLMIMQQVQKIHLKLEDLRLRLNEPIVPLTNDAILHLSTELQPLYRALIMYNLDEFIARNLETALWNDCFKTPLTRFGRTDKNLFNLMIEYGVGFYLGLIQDIGVHFDISFITNAPSITKLYCTSPVTDTNFIKPSKSSIYFIIQNCLLHVGDLLRYRGTNYPEAIKMYEKSAAVCPSNGYPFHQMGLTQLLIATTSGEEANRMEGFLTCLYYFARSLSVSNRYIPAFQSIENLVKVKVEPDTNKLSKSQEMLRLFMISIQENSSLPTLAQVMNQVVQSLEVSASTLFKMIVIALWNNWRNQFRPSSLDIVLCVLNSVVTALQSAFEDSLLQTSPYIPHIKILIEWMNWHQDNQAMTYFFGKVNSSSLVSVLNHLRTRDQFTLSPPNSWVLEAILPEEKKLIGFIPMDYSQCFNAGSSVSGGAIVPPKNYSSSTTLSSNNGSQSQSRSAPMGGHLLSEDKDFVLSLNLRVHRIVCVALRLASNKKGFLFDGSKFHESGRSSPFNLAYPSRRNVALQSIFRTNCNNNANSSSAFASGPELMDNNDQQVPQLVAPTSSCASSIISSSSCASNASSWSLNAAGSSSLSPTANLTTTHDFFRSIWSPDTEITDSKWN